MSDQARLWIFGVVFLVFGVVFLVRGFKLSGKPFLIIHILSGTILFIAACTEFYLALTFKDRRATATARNEMLNRQGREYERTLQEKSEHELQQRMPLLRGISPEDSENKKKAHNEASDANLARADMIVTNPVEAVRGVLPSGWTILRVETNTYPSCRPKGNGTAVFLGLKGKEYLKQDYAAVLHIMPSEYEDGGKDPTHGQAQSWPARLIATTDKAKVYLWPGPQVEDWKTMQTDLLKALIKKEE